MGQVTDQSVHFQTALASIKLIQDSAVLDLTEDDFDFLTSNKVWIATDRSRAPVEFIAAVIAYYVHSVNIQTACFFFFSSRRRHTSSLRDGSSDVCSSDLFDRGADVPASQVCIRASDGRSAPCR